MMLISPVLFCFFQSGDEKLAPVTLICFISLLPAIPQVYVFVLPGEWQLPQAEVCACFVQCCTLANLVQRVSANDGSTS
jgi:hypothetical protein